MSTDGDVVREAHQDAKDVLATCLPGYGVKLFDADERFDAALARLEARCERLELIRERRIEADLAFRKAAYAHIERLEGALRDIARGCSNWSPDFSLGLIEKKARAALAEEPHTDVAKKEK